MVVDPVAPTKERTEGGERERRERVSEGRKETRRGEEGERGKIKKKGES